MTKRLGRLFMACPFCKSPNVYELYPVLTKEALAVWRCTHCEKEWDTELQEIDDDYEEELKEA